MLKTLYAKLSAVLLGLFALIGISYIVLSLYTTHLYLQEVNQKLNRTLAGNLASEKILMKDGQVDHDALKKIFDMLMVINPNIEIYLLNPEGRILAYSAPPGKVQRTEVSLEPLNRFLGDHPVFPILGDDPRDLSREKVFSTAPISVEDRIQGYLYVILGGEQYDTVAQMLQGSYILRLSLWGAVGGLLFALVAGLVLFRLLTRRLTSLSERMDTFTRNNFSEPPTLSSLSGPILPDEVDRLDESFLQMADRILMQIQALKQTDRLRRELVANVSHDLRTPLASLQGYLETILLKEGRISAEEQKRYLEIAHRHSARLGKLVSELFELAKLDARETHPHVEAFSMGELVQDVLQKLQLSAERKGVGLHPLFRVDLPFVRADIALIERVLENLLENALRHTPEGGMVSVTMIPEEDHMKVQIKDTGTGIPEEEIPHIFDRFRRVKRDDRDRSDGAGLGLAISKRILDLHHSSIEVKSRFPDGGTVVSFTLPLSAPSPLP